MNDDLDKAEQEWANRSLFKPQRRRGRWIWLLLLLLVAVGLVLRYNERLMAVF